MGYWQNYFCVLPAVKLPASLLHPVILQIRGLEIMYTMMTLIGQLAEQFFDYLTAGKTLMALTLCQAAIYTSIVEIGQVPNPSYVF
jgi:hypothetical protein